MSGSMQELIFCVLVPVYLFGGFAGIAVFTLYKIFPGLDGFLERLGFDFGLFDDKKGVKKLPVVREHKQAVGICTNGKFENPIKDYNTRKKELQEV